MKNKKSAAGRAARNGNSYRSETTTTERVYTTTSQKRPQNGRGSGSTKRGFKPASDRNAPSSSTSSRSWELRPHENKMSLPSPGSAVNTNDERWYIGKLQDQANRFASVPWTAIAGDTMAPNSGIYTYVGSQAVQYDNPFTVRSREFPSVMVAGLIPALGNTCIDPNRLDMPWMTTAEQKIAYLQSKISGSLPFAAADLVCYWLCAADVFAEIADAERALKIARTWRTFENISYPRQLCAALGWNFEDIMGNILVFEGQIQEIINLANTLLLPKDLALVERWYFLYSHVFKDSNLPTAKLYAYRKDGYYTFEETTYQTGTSCEFHAADTFPGEGGWKAPGMWFEQMYDSINKLLPGRSTAIVDIMAKLLRAYDVSTFFAYPDVSKDGIDAKFDPIALTAFANLQLTNIPFRLSVKDQLDKLDLVQDVGSHTLAYKGMLINDACVFPKNALLRAWEAHPTVGSLLEMTRLTVCADMLNEAVSPERATELNRMRLTRRDDESEADFEDRVTVTSPTYWLYTGTEMVTNVSIYTGPGDTSASRTPVMSATSAIQSYTTYDAAFLRTQMENLIHWNKFEYAPMLLGAYVTSSSEAPEWYSAETPMILMADVDNYTSVTSDVLGRIHRLAIANLWGVQTDFIG